MRQLAQFIRARNAPVILVMVSLALMPVIGLAAPRPGEPCENVAGTLQGFAVPVIEDNELVGFHLTSTVITGPLAGQMTAVVVVENVTPGGTIHFGGTHFFTGTQFGDFQTDDRGVVTPSGQANSHLEIVTGASGFIKGHGTVDSSTGAVELRYHGRVCV